MNELEIFHTLIRYSVPAEAIFDILDYGDVIVILIHFEYSIPVEDICNELGAEYRNQKEVFHNFTISRVIE